jgi:hypothetical protein
VATRSDPRCSTALPQTQTQTACSTGSPNNHLSMGDQIDAASVNPFTSGNGGIWGGNRQSFPATTNNYTYSGKGLGVDVGVSIQSAWAWGSGSWSGPFHSVNWSLGVFSGSIFWTPGKGGMDRPFVWPGARAAGSRLRTDELYLQVGAGLE